MKKIIFSSLLFCSFFAKAQFTKGDKYLGGGIGLGFSTSSSSQNNSVFTGSGNNFGINLNPQFFKATNANTLSGFTVGLGFSYSTANNGIIINSSKYKDYSISASIGYAIRKYKPLSEKLFWYMEYNVNVGYSYAWQNNTYTNPNGMTKSDGMGYNASINVLPALALKVDNRFLIDVNFGGLSTDYNYSSSEGVHSHNFSANINLTSRLTLGILWKLKKSAHS